MSLHHTVLHLERDGLMTRRLAGVPYWPLLRSLVFNAAFAALGLHARISPTTRRRHLARGLTEVAPLVATPGATRLPAPGNYDVVLVPLLRKHRVDGRLVDVHSEPVLAAEGIGRLLVADHPPLVSASTRHRVFSLGPIRARTLVSTAATHNRWLRAAAAEVRELDGIFRDTFAVPFPLSARHLAFRVTFFTEGRRRMRHFLATTGAHTVIGVGRHARSGLMAAGRDLGLRTMEIQHGLISPLHLDYHFPDHPSLPYFASELLVYGQRWLDGVALPAHSTTHVIGAAHLGSRHVRIDRQPGLVVVASQGTIGTPLFRAMLVAARLAPHWTFVFVPHPQEPAGSYDAALSAEPSAPTNVRIATADEPLYTVMAKADVQLGVYSTALFEGMAQGVRTVVLALPGSENLSAAIAQGDAVLAPDPQSIPACLESAPLCRDPEGYYSRIQAKWPELLAARR